MSKRTKYIVWGVAAFFGLTIILGLTGNLDEEPVAADTTTTTVQETTTTEATTTTTTEATTTTTTEAVEAVEDSVAYKLAVVDEGGYVSPDDRRVTLYDGALKAAERACPGDGAEGVADMAVVGRQILAEEYGIDVTAIELVRGLTSGVEPIAPVDDCAPHMSALIVLIVEQS